MTIKKKQNIKLSTTETLEFKDRKCSNAANDNVKQHMPYVTLKGKITCDKGRTTDSTGYYRDQTN